MCRALATGEISSEGSAYHEFPPAPLATKPVQDPIPFWYPGNPAVAGRHGMSLMWPGPIDQQAYDVYVEAWERHRGDTLRVDGSDSRPRVGCTMILAIAPTEREALDISRRGMDGLVRRAEAVHQNDRLIMSPEDCERALGPLRAILEHVEDAVAAGSGTVEQITERFAAMLEPGLIEHVDLQLPTGDMTFDEARRSFELFAAEVKPQLERASLASST
jgi:alkanesulfonate monooxygenase SsuD/methylene tetrahydromethanopterin reductase-like flavin-dependent oxidoreductase (luciferase family)